MAKLVVGQEVPAFSLADLEGNLVALADFHGRPVLLNFWSAECPVVERADQALAGRLAEVVLLTIAANANEPLDCLRSAARERGLRLVLTDPDQRVADLYGAQTTPYFFLVDAAGRLTYQGALDDVTFRRRVPTRNYVLEAIAALQSGQPAPVPETPGYGCIIVRNVNEET